MRQQINLFARANQNSGHIEARYAVCLTGEVGPVLTEFAAFVRQEGKISINCKPTDCEQFLTTGQYWNAHELAEVAAEHAGLTKAEALQKQQGAYYIKRRGFDETFENGERFRYGALNTGGMGATHFGGSYGGYCVVLQGDFPETRGEVAYVKYDSLDNYVDAAGRVDVARLGPNLAADSHKCRLAAIKHEAEITTHPRDAWPSLLCADTYMEVVFLQPPVRTAIDRVRMDAHYMADTEHMLKTALTTGLAGDEAKRLSTYRKIQLLLREHHIVLEGV